MIIINRADKGFMVYPEIISSFNFSGKLKISFIDSLVLDTYIKGECNSRTSKLNSGTSVEFLSLKSKDTRILTSNILGPVLVALKVIGMRSLIDYSDLRKEYRCNNELLSKAEHFCEVKKLYTKRIRETLSELNECKRLKII